jgi:hypothetical protein
MGLGTARDGVRGLRASLVLCATPHGGADLNDPRVPVGHFAAGAARGTTYAGAAGEK